MERIQHNNTRRFVYLLPALVFFPVGWAFVVLAAYGVLAEHDASLLGPGVIGLALGIGGTYFLYRLVFPRASRGVVTDNAIWWEYGGEEKGRIAGEAIEGVSVPYSMNTFSYIVRLRSGGRTRINPFYFPDRLRAEQDLEACGYRVTRH